MKPFGESLAVTMNKHSQPDLVFTALIALRPHRPWEPAVRVLGCPSCPRTKASGGLPPPSAGSFCVWAGPPQTWAERDPTGQCYHDPEGGWGPLHSRPAHSLQSPPPSLPKSRAWGPGLSRPNPEAVSGCQQAQTPHCPPNPTPCSIPSGCPAIGRERGPRTLLGPAGC